MDEWIYRRLGIYNYPLVLDGCLGIHNYLLAFLSPVLLLGLCFITSFFSSDGLGALVVVSCSPLMV